MRKNGKAWQNTWTNHCQALDKRWSKEEISVKGNIKRGCTFALAFCGVGLEGCSNVSIGKHSPDRRHTGTKQGPVPGATETAAFVRYDVRKEITGQSTYVPRHWGVISKLQRDAGSHPCWGVWIGQPESTCQAFKKTVYLRNRAVRATLDLPYKSLIQIFIG